MAKNTSKNVKTAGFRPVQNEELYRAMTELRRSSAASRHTLKAYKGSRTANKRAAIKDYR